MRFWPSPAMAVAVPRVGVSPGLIQRGALTSMVTQHRREEVVFPLATTWIYEH